MSGGNYADQSALATQAYQNYLSYRQQHGSDPTGYDTNPNDPSAAQAKQAEAYQYLKYGAQQYGDNYIDPATGRSKAMGPKDPDLTDALLQKTRTNFALRLMSGKSQSNSFGAQTGGLDLSKNILGGS